MKSKKFSNTTFNIIFTITFCALFLFFCVKQNTIEKKLISDYQLTKCKITRFKIEGPRNVYPPEYSFSVNGQYYKGDVPLKGICKSLTNEEKKEIKNSSFELAYYTLNPEISKILITKQDYLQFDLKYPEKQNNHYEILEKYFNCNWTFFRYLTH